MRILERLGWISLLLLVMPCRAADVSGVVRARGNSVPAAVVRFHRLDATTGKQANIYVTRSDSEGRYALRGLIRSSYIVIVEVDGRRVYQDRATVQADNVTLDITW